MNVFDQIVIPPSANHVLMLKIILSVSMLLFIPFVCTLLGSSILSVYYSRLGTRSGNKMYARFAKDIIEKLTFAKNAGIALGVLPLLSITFAYAQLLYQAQTIAFPVLLFVDVVFIFAFVFIYKYRNSFFFEDVLSSLKGKTGKGAGTAQETEDVKEYEQTIINSSSESGWIGMMLIVFAVYLFGGCISLTTSPFKWAEVDNILLIIFSLATLFKFAYLLAAAGSITGGAILFYFFKWQGGIKNMSADYSKLVRNLALSLTLFSVLALPVLIFLNILFLPQTAFSGNVFLYLFLTLVAVVIILNILYSMIKNSEVKFAASVFVLIIAAFMFNILSEQYVFGNALEDQVTAVTTKADEYDKKIEANSVAVSNIDPQQIYNTKCIACHRFDVRLVGPPYNQTVPTFNGDVNALANIIYSPSVTPTIPGYPAMPSQGLKKSEALAMAKWLIEKVGKK